MDVKRVIVADPCPDNRESLALLLRLHGVAAEGVEDLDRLQILLRTFPADIVITEVFGTTQSTCTAIRNAAPNVAVAFYTTRSHPADLCRSARQGCRHFIKATDLDRLLDWLDLPRRVPRSWRRVTTSPLDDWTWTRPRLGSASSTSDPDLFDYASWTPIEEAFESDRLTER